MTHTHTLQLFEGTIQGCPLSPLLFVRAIESLAGSIRTDPNIQGTDITDTPDKIFIYMDDVLLLITQPQLSLPMIIDKINQFGSFSG